MQDTFWTPELWCEFLEGYSISSGLDIFKAAEQFKSSKSPKKEWEIVAFKQDGRIFKLVENWEELRHSKPVYSDEESVMGITYGLEPKNNCTIHSVRRLPDDWTVSVKDKVKAVSGKIGTIQAINADGHILFSDLTGLEHITTIQKLPQPILTTVDAVEKFEGDTMYVVFEDFTAYLYSVSEKVYKEMKDRVIAFCSTSKAAEEWKVENKPLLSLNDVKYYVKGGESASFAIERLTTLVKQKLNQ